MKQILLPILFGLLFTLNLQAQTVKNDTLPKYENNLREDYLTELSFNLIDRFYDNEDLRIAIAEWLNLGSVFSLKDFENSFSEFTSREHKNVRDKIFTGMYTHFGNNDKEILYKNLYFVTYNRKTANYWVNYILNHYSSVNEKTNKITYSETWNIIGTKDNDKGIFKITKYEDWTCKIVLSIQNQTYKSFECEEDKAKLKTIDGDTIEIEYVMPELTDIFIDILGNDTKFDYVLNEEFEEQKTIKDELKAIKEPKRNRDIEQFKTSTRKLIYKPKITSNCTDTGVVKLKVQINKKGEVADVRPLQNIYPCLTKQAIRLAKLHQWEKSKNGTIETLNLEIVFE